MKILKSFIVYFFIIFLFTSCSTTSVMRLRPIGEESIFDGGKQIVKQEKDGVKVVASYDGKFQQYMVLT